MNKDELYEIYKDATNLTTGALLMGVTAFKATVLQVKAGASAQAFIDTFTDNLERLADTLDERDAV